MHDKPVAADEDIDTVRDLNLHDGTCSSIPYSILLILAISSIRTT